MSGRQTKDKSFPGGDSLGTDWFYPVDGGSAQVPRDGTDGPETRDITLECKDRFCPVPWATKPYPTGAQLEQEYRYTDWVSKTFLTEDRNSNFLRENTIPLRPELQPDLVNHPPHYADGGIECIESIEAQLSPEEYRGYLRGNCAKYLWRCMLKGDPLENLLKCEWYLKCLIRTYQV